MKSILGLDIGTSSVKGLLTDPDSQQSCSRTIEYRLEKDTSGRVESDPAVYWQSVLDVLAGLRADEPELFSAVRAVGVTSQGETVIPVDADGTPLRNAVVWLDSRAGQEAAEIASRFTLQTIYQTTGQQEVVPSATACVIKWLTRHEPRITERVCKYLLVQDYIIFKLTSEFLTDRAMIPSTLLYDMTSGSWWSEMCEEVCVRPEQLPQPGSPSTAEVSADAASETGLGKGVVVSTTPIDQITGAVGAGNIAPAMLTETTGTALAVCATLDRPVHDPGMRMGLFHHAAPGCYALLPWAPVSGMILRWFRDECCGDLSFNDMNRLAETVSPGSNGLLMLPHFEGSISPVSNPNARGILMGLTISHTKAHIIRAIMESIAFLLRHNVDTLQTLGAGAEQIISLGGAARSPVWSQIKADVLNKPVVIPFCEETTCLGAAMIAGVSAGIFPDLKTAVEEVVRIRKTIDPSPENSKKYASAYQWYTTVNQCIHTQLNGGTPCTT